MTTRGARTTQQHLTNTIQCDTHESTPYTAGGGLRDVTKHTYTTTDTHTHTHTHAHTRTHTHTHTHTHIHTHSHTHIHTRTRRMQHHRNNQIQVSGLPLTVARQTQCQCWLCNCCSRGEDGLPLDPPRNHRTVGFAGQIGHSGGTFHTDRLHRLPPGEPMWLQGDVVFETVHRCNACCLTKTGHTKSRALSIVDSTLAEHVAGRKHIRRAGDGRMALYVALHGPGVHVAIVGDRW
jgi:hypothetical protein